MSYNQSALLLCGIFLQHLNVLQHKIYSTFIIKHSVVRQYNSCLYESILTDIFQYALKVVFKFPWKLNNNYHSNIFPFQVVTIHNKCSFFKILFRSQRDSPVDRLLALSATDPNSIPKDHSVQPGMIPKHRSRSKHYSLLDMPTPKKYLKYEFYILT